MRGYLRQRTPGSWTIQVYLGRDPGTGKKTQRSRTVRGTKKDADRALAQWVAEIDSGGAYVEPSAETVSVFLKRWLRDHAANLDPETARGYRIKIDTHVNPALGATPLRNVTPRQIQSFYSARLGRGLSPTTVLQIHRILHRAFNSAVRWGAITRNPCDAVDPPKRRRFTPELPNDVQLARLVEAIRRSETWSTAILLGLYTGMRRGELLRLTWANVDLEGRFLSVRQSKTDAGRRRIDLSPDIVDVLGVHKERQTSYKGGRDVNLIYDDQDAIFADPFGKPYEPNSFTHAFKAIATSVGLPNMRLHDLRHLHATLLLAEGIHSKVVSDRLGHSSVRVTGDLYSHVTPTIQREAAEAIARRIRLPGTS